MTSFTDSEHEIFTSIPTWTCEWPEVVVRDSIVAPELSTQANPIVIGDYPAPLGSASNPIVIHVDEGWCRDETDQLSDADTEIMATPEFWGTLIGGTFAVPVDEGAAVDPSSIRAPTRSLGRGDPEGLQPFEQSIPNSFHLDDKTLKVTEDTFDVSQKCSGLEAAKSENVANDYAESEQSPEKGKLFEAEELREARSVPETTSMTRDAVAEEIRDQTDTSLGKGLSCDSYDVGSTKRRLSHGPAANLNGIDPLGKEVSAWQSSISTTVGDELAAIYDHMDHCQNADCLHAKAFYDGIQSPRNTLPSNPNRIRRTQGRSEGGRVTIRLHVPDFQKEAICPEGFIVNRVIIRTAFFSPRSPCNLDICKQDDVLFGRGVVVVPFKGEDPKCFLTFSPEDLQGDHGTNAPASGKWSDGIVIIESVVPEWKKGANWLHGFIGRVSIELYKTWPPSDSEYEEREDSFGRVVVSIHSDRADPKCFLTFSSGQSSADHMHHSPAPGNGVPEPSMVSDAIIQETTDQVGTPAGENLPRSSHAGSVKRKLSHDGIQSELRRSERLAKRART